MLIIAMDVGSRWRKEEIMGDRGPRVLLSWHLVHIFKTGLALFPPTTFLDANTASATAMPDGVQGSVYRVCKRWLTEHLVL